MKKLILWILALSLGISVLILVFLVAGFWWIMGVQQIEFEVTGTTILFLWSLIFLVLLITLSGILLRRMHLIIQLLSENPFSESVTGRMVSLDPLSFFINTLKRTNEKGRFEIEKLNKLEQYRREYIGNVSHELKTPIFNIQGFISSLLEGGMDDPMVNRLFLEKAEKNVDRMINIVQDLQTISRFEAGELELQKEPFEIYQLIEDVIDTEKDQAEKNSVVFELLKGKPVLVYADKFRIRQVITNLLVNSVKYSKPGGGKTVIRIYNLDHSVRVEISDNGIGIEEKHLPRIFERFYRVDSSRSREKGGSGLGLAIVKHIIEAHGENIEVLSTAGVGTLFRFSLQHPDGEV